MIQSDSHNSLLETSLTGKTILLSPQPNPYILIIIGKTIKESCSKIKLFFICKRSVFLVETKVDLSNHLS